MRELITATVTISILLTFFAQLEDQAHAVSAKTLLFTQDMQDGLDCVLDGKLLIECEPQLVGDYGFDENLNETQAILDEIEITLSTP